jgi:hypothetical protein
MIKSKSVSKSPSLELETKIKTLQDQNDGLNIELKRIQGDLTKIKAILNHKLDNNRMVLEERLNKLDLNELQNKKLIAYYQTFTKTLEENYITSISIASGKITTVSNNHALASFMGPMALLLISAKNTIDNMKAKHDAKIIMNLASNTLEFNDLVCKIGIKLLSHDKKRQEIFSIKEDSNKKINKFFHFLEKEEKVLNKINIEIDEVNSVIKLATQDALMLVMGCVSGQIIPNDTMQHLEYENQFVDFVTDNVEFQAKFDEICTKQLPKADKTIEGKQGPNKSCCEIFMLNNIIYDNPDLVKDLQLQYYLNIPRLGSIEDLPEDGFH